MNIISHIAYPVLLAQSANIFRTQNQKETFFKGKHLLLIGICGGLPDILSPHLNLEARYNSFSHSLGFVLVITILSVILSRKIPKHKILIYFCYFATVLHLIGDMMANGINLFGPFGRMVVGSSLIPSQYWISLDATGILFLFVSFIYYRCPVRIRSAILVSGCAVALCGAVMFFTVLDSETVFIKKIPNSKINVAQLKDAQRIWNTLQAKWQAGNFERLSSEFTVEMQQGITPQFQKESFQKIKGAHGDYKGILFVEAKTARFYYPRMTVYRFKGAYSNTSQQPEIGIVFDPNSRISGYIFRDHWKDKLLQ
jgi:hypothetical protein